MRKLADTTVGERVTRYDPLTGRAYLTDPAVWDAADPSTWVEMPWPLAGVEIVGPPPRRVELPQRWVERAEAEGWVELKGRKIVHRPGGPEHAPWAVTHTFVQADKIVIKTSPRTVYRVVESPDKWPVSKNERDEGFGGDVRWYFEAELDS